MVAAACLDSSLRWFSIFSTFASSSGLMYSVSGGANWACVGWMAPSGSPEAAEWCTGAAAALKNQPGQWALGRAGLALCMSPSKELLLGWWRGA